jgi:hypothetical protein
LRDFLLYIPAAGGRFVADILGPDRLYDVAVNDFRPQDARGPIRGVEYVFYEPCHKWPGIVRNLEYLPAYQAYCFLDDDIAVDTWTMDRLFRAGLAAGLDCWQASLTCWSHAGWPHTVSQAGGPQPRPVHFVEIMMPIFSAAGLAKCRATFARTESGWGIDFVWPILLGREHMGIFDDLRVTHTRPVNSHAWRLSNGKTPRQEALEVMREYGISGPQFGLFDQTSHPDL